MTHQAAWIQQRHAALEVDSATTPTPGPSDVLVKVQAIAFSPIEYKLQRFEIHPFPYPQILGQSFAGTVEKVGDGVKGFNVGDKVAVLRREDLSSDPRYGAFQQFALAPVANCSKLKPETPLDAGASTVINLATVSSALSVFGNLPRPTINGKAPRAGKKVLVYGGSSSSGGFAIRYARAAGWDVVTTSSPKHHDYVSSLGPAVILDHTAPAEKIVEGLRANGPYDTILDTIGIPPVTEIIVEYLSGLGGGSYHCLIPALPGEKPIPDNIHCLFESYGFVFEDPKHKELRDWFYDELLPEGLASGVIIPTRSQWVKGGLSQAQQALDMMAEGKVSGCKLLMDPWE